jgi:hypothetical protein
MKATIGRIVHYYEGDFEAIDGSRFGKIDLTYEERSKLLLEHGAKAQGVNGSRWHPAIITQVWGDDCVNLTVFFGDGQIAARSSACRLPDELFANGVHCANSGWRWPEVPRAA